MSLWVGITLTAALIVTALLLALLARLNQRLLALRAELDQQPVAPTPEDSRARITIEILNPFELAARESPFAGAAAKLAPSVIRRIVYARAAEEIARQMAEQGVHAEVTHYVD